MQETDTAKIAILKAWASEDFSDKEKLHESVTTYYHAVVDLDQQLSRVTDRSVYGEINRGLVQLDGEFSGVFSQRDLMPTLSSLADNAGVSGLKQALSPKKIGGSWENVLGQLGQYPF